MISLDLSVLTGLLALLVTGGIFIVGATALFYTVLNKTLDSKLEAKLRESKEEINKKLRESKEEINKIRLDQKFLIDSVKILSNEVRENGK